MIYSPPLALYVHFPWCVKKCPYCDFNSHAMPREFNQMQYIQALIDDLDYQLARFKPSKPLHSIFFGGGTPSLFRPDSLSLLLRNIAARFDYVNDIEITLESNPGAVEHHDMGAYREAGINRLSIGAQSFEPSKLKTLGRIHTPDDVYNCFNAARVGGYENINIDLMFGLPDQNEDQALLDLETALGLEPEHLSLYQLTLEPNTVFHRYPPKLPDPDNVIGM
ncbi:MAG: radical SAM family heme chaperone HemW, partial [Gammaproteobacteria bacterium]